MTTQHGFPANYKFTQRTDPAGADEIWRARHTQAIEDFLDGAVSRDVFAGLLFGLGFRASDLSAELYHYEQLKLNRS